MIIGLTGKRRVGKNYVAQIITAMCRESGLSVKEVSFSDKLKEAVKTIFGVTDEMLEGDKEAMTQAVYRGGRLSVRRLLQVFGTETMRQEYSQNIWVHAWMRTVFSTKADVIIATDVRFANEAAAIRELEGRIYRVTGPQRGALDNSLVNGHVSEQQKLHVDADILNTDRPAVVEQIAALLNLPDTILG